MSRGFDPFRSRCDYREEAQQFGEQFECTEAADHSGSHYDSFLDMWAPKR
ncbi:hypothetical protein SEA_NANOSMITE_45 [Mycobacterium phage Nanosmite]|nr:hypothetical protein SEA_NANOSMITE_45 [Mycobacterium phage Nanosmite]